MRQVGLSLFSSVVLIGLMATVLWTMVFVTSIRDARTGGMVLPIGQPIEVHVGERFRLPGGQSRLVVFDVAYRASGEAAGPGLLTANAIFLVDGPRGSAILALVGPDDAPTLLYGAFRLHVLSVSPASGAVTIALEKVPSSA